MKNTLYILGFIILLGFWLLLKEDKHKWGEGIFFTEIPVQWDLDDNTNFEYNSIPLVPMVNYRMTGKVLSKKNYYFDEESKLCPVDIAFGWANMSNERILKNLKIRQSDRWYYWSSSKGVLPKREIESSSANMHLIPANSSVRNKIKDTQTWDIVMLSGKLVTAVMGDGYRWVSSVSRMDTGDNSCELIWVEEYKILDAQTISEN